MQFDVLEYRLKNEYNVEIKMQPLPYRFIRFIEMDKFDPSEFRITPDTMLVQTINEDPAILFHYEWSIKQVKENNPNAKLNEISVEQ